MKLIGIIPCHLDSVRLKRKAIIKINNIPMIEHVRRRLVLSNAFDEVFIASGDDAIIQICKDFNSPFIRTYQKHDNGTNRVIEAIRDRDCTHVIIAQGDEPLILPNDLKLFANKIRSDKNVAAWNCVGELSTASELSKHSFVKCMIGLDHKIISLFRKTPFYSSFEKQKKYVKKILGLMAYKKEVLMNLNNLRYGQIFKDESIEQMRLIENGIDIYGFQLPNSFGSVNEAADLEIVNDQLTQSEIQRSVVKKILHKWSSRKD